MQGLEQEVWEGQGLVKGGVRGTGAGARGVRGAGLEQGVSIKVLAPLHMILHARTFQMQSAPIHLSFHACLL